MNFKEMLKNTLQGGLHRLGYHIHQLERGASKVDPYTVQRHLAGSDVEILFEVGAADGRDVLVYHEMFPKAVIHCFEPIPDSFMKLVEKTAGFDRVRANQCALSENEGVAQFHMAALTDASSLFASKPTDFSYDRYTRPAGIIDVKTDTIDTYCAREQIDRIDVLKMDAQGAELLVLKGATAMLARGAIGLIYTEINFLDHFDGGVRFDKLMGFLCDEHGFKLHNIYGMVHNQRGELAWADAIFTHGSLSA